MARPDRQREGPTGSCRSDLPPVQIVLVARTTVVARAVVVATRAGSGAAAAATTEGATERSLLTLEDTTRLAGRDGHTTGHARTGGGQQRVARSCPGRHDVDAGLASHSFHAALLVRERQGDDAALLAGAGRTPGAVKVVLVVGRRVSLQDDANVVHVDASGCDVRGDQNRQAAVLERIEHAVASILGESTCLLYTSPSPRDGL